MAHEVHPDHVHVHGPHCGHTQVRHGDHMDYLHHGHIHCPHDGHYDERAIPVTAANPAACAPVRCACGHYDCGHEAVRHGDHIDYLYEGRLHQVHGDHCDDHGPLDMTQP